jgi:hypothetical protein
VRSLVAGGAQDGQNVARRFIVSVDTLHLRSDHVIGSDHMQSISAVNGREAVREKMKRRLIIDGIFVVVVLKAVGWIRTGYAHPVLDRFLSKMQF